MGMFKPRGKSTRDTARRARAAGARDDGANTESTVSSSVVDKAFRRVARFFNGNSEAPATESCESIEPVEQQEPKQHQACLSWVKSTGRRSSPVESAEQPQPIRTEHYAEIARPIQLTRHEAMEEVQALALEEMMRKWHAERCERETMMLENEAVRRGAEASERKAEAAERKAEVVTQNHEKEKSLAVEAAVEATESMVKAEVKEEMRDREAEFQNIVQIHLITEDKAWEKAWESQCQVKTLKERLVLREAQLSMARMEREEKDMQDKIKDDQFANDKSSFEAEREELKEALAQVKKERDAITRRWMMEDDGRQKLRKTETALALTQSQLQEVQNSAASMEAENLQLKEQLRGKTELELEHKELELEYKDVVARLEAANRLNVEHVDTLAKANMAHRDRLLENTELKTEIAKIDDERWRFRKEVTVLAHLKERLPDIEAHDVMQAKIDEHIAREASLLEQLQEAKDQHKQALAEAREQHEHTLEDHQADLKWRDERLVKQNEAYKLLKAEFDQGMKVAMDHMDRHELQLKRAEEEKGLLRAELKKHKMKYEEEIKGHKAQINLVIAVAAERMDGLDLKLKRAAEEKGLLLAKIAELKKALAVGSKEAVEEEEGKAVQLAQDKVACRLSAELVEAMPLPEEDKVAHSSARLDATSLSQNNVTCPTVESVALEGSAVRGAVQAPAGPVSDVTYTHGAQLSQGPVTCPTAESAGLDGFADRLAVQDRAASTKTLSNTDTEAVQLLQDTVACPSAEPATQCEEDVTQLPITTTTHPAEPIAADAPAATIEPEGQPGGAPCNVVAAEEEEEPLL